MITRILAILLISVMVMSASVSFAGRYSVTEETSAQNAEFSVNVSGLPVAALVKLLGQHAGENVAVDTDFWVDGKLNSPRVSFTYTGSSIEAALTLLCEANNIHWKKLTSGYVVSKFRTSIIAVSQAHYVSFSATEESSKHSITGGGDFRYLKYVATQARKFLSKTGTLAVSPSGLITVRDRPANVCDIENFIRAEESRHGQVTIYSKLVRQAKVENGTVPKTEVLHEWSSSSVIGSVMPFTKNSTATETASKFKMFVTPLRVEDSGTQIAVYVSHAADARVSFNTTLLIPKDGTAILAGLDIDDTYEYFVILGTSEKAFSVTNSAVNTRCAGKESACYTIRYTDPTNVF